MKRAISLLMVLGLVLLVPNAALADATEERARKLFFQARSDMAGKRYVSAEAKLRRVHQMMGNRLRILVLWTEALVRTRQYVDALAQTRAYLSLAPPVDGVETQIMKRRLGSLHRLATMQRTRYQKATGPMLSSYDQYLRKHPHGAWAIDVRQRRKQQATRNRNAADDSNFAAAKSRDEVKAYESYLRRFAKGRHVAEARLRVDQIREAQRIAGLQQLEKNRQQRYSALQRQEADYASRARGHYGWGTASIIGGVGLIGGSVTLAIARPIGDAGSILLAIPMAAGGLFFTFGYSQWQFADGKRDAKRRDQLRRQKQSVADPIRIGLDLGPSDLGGRKLGLVLSGHF